MRLWLATLFAFICGFGCAQDSKPVLTVYAAASLEDVLREAGTAWSEQNGLAVRFNFAGSNELTRQLLAGAHADVLFSANTREMERLIETGCVEASATQSFLSNHMVLIARRDAELQAGLAHSLALAEESVPVGRYGREWMKARSDLTFLAGEPRVLSTLNARATLGAVESGAAQLGLVYKSDALVSESVVALVSQAPGEAPRIRYPVAVLREARLAEQGRSFVSFLKSRRELFERYGFSYRP